MTNEVKQKFIRNFNAIDVTAQKNLNEFIKGKNKEIIYIIWHMRHEWLYFYS